MRKPKPDAYARFFTGRPEDVIKCDECGFKAVKMQFDDNESKCPRCQVDSEVVKGHSKRKVI